MIQSHPHCQRQSLPLIGWLGLALVVLIAAVAGGCDDEGPIIVPESIVRASPTAASTPEGEVLDASPAFRVEPDAALTLPMSLWVSFAHGADIWRLPIDGPASPLISGYQLTSASSSATGDRTAVLVDIVDGDSDQNEQAVLVFRPDGHVVLEISDVRSRSSELDLGPVSEIAVSPDGDRVAAAHQNGAVSVVGSQGEITLVIPPNPTIAPGGLQWSPDGRFLAYLDPWAPSAPSSLYVAMPSTSVWQALAHPTGDQYGVVAAQWIPGTTSIAFVQNSVATIPYGGDLFAVDVVTGSSSLLLSSGEFAPVAGFVDIAPSHDGEWIAMTIYVPGDGKPRFHELWTVNLDTGARQRVPVGDGRSVTDLWWLGRALVYRAVDNPRSARPGVYTGMEDYVLVEYHPGTNVSRDRHGSP